MKAPWSMRSEVRSIRVVRDLVDLRESALLMAREALEREPDLGLLYTSGHATTDGMNALFVDNSAFLPKPYRVDQLRTMLSVNSASGRIRCRRRRMALRPS